MDNKTCFHCASTISRNFHELTQNADVQLVSGLHHPGAVVEEFGLSD
jgi:DNA-directed RNA polymerase subunit N (RpoN/RPB10)